MSYASLFTDGFESGDLSGFDFASSPGPSNEITAGAAAKFLRSYGCEILLDSSDTTQVYVTASSGISDESNLTVAFPLRLDSAFTMTDPETLRLIQIEDSSTFWSGRVLLHRDSSAWKLAATIRHKTVGSTTTSLLVVPLADGWHDLAFRFVASDDEIFPNGSVAISVDGVVEEEETGIDSFGRTYDRAKIGASALVGSNADGKIYFDSVRIGTGGYPPTLIRSQHPELVPVGDAQFVAGRRRARGLYHLEGEPV